MEVSVLAGLEYVTTILQSASAKIFLTDCGKWLCPRDIIFIYICTFWLLIDDRSFLSINIIIREHILITSTLQERCEKWAVCVSLSLSRFFLSLSCPVDVDEICTFLIRSHNCQYMHRVGYRFMSAACMFCKSQTR
jgi:hypothetical protein